MTVPPRSLAIRRDVDTVQPIRRIAGTVRIPVFSGEFEYLPPVVFMVSDGNIQAPTASKYRDAHLKRPLLSLLSATVLDNDEPNKLQGVVHWAGVKRYLKIPNNSTLE